MLLAAWLATYAIHSTILLVSALVASSIIKSDATRDLLWKVAIFGGLVTTTVATLMGSSPFGSTWRIASVESSRGVETVTANNKQGAAEVAPTSDARVNQEVADHPVSQTQASETLLYSSVLPAVIVLWAAVSVLLLIRLLAHHARLIHGLRDRVSITEGRLPGMLAELRRRSAVWTPVRLSSSAACPTPLAIGRREICVPRRFETDLDDEQQRNALAHELAHLQRRDPVWQFGIGIIESIFFFQPLNTVGRKRLREAAEYLCDDWAVEQTRAPLELARCLTQISSWVGTVPVPDGTLAMAEGGSSLVSRVQRLAEWRAPSKAATRVAFVGAALLVSVVATSAPAFSANGSMSSPADRSIATVLPAIEPDVVVPYTGPAASLAARFKWAQANARQDTYWIGWEVDAVESRSAIASSSLGAPRPAANSPSLAALVHSTGSDRNGAIMIEFDTRGNAIATRIQRKSDQVSLGGRTLMWLGHGIGGESISQLQSVLQNATSAPVRSELNAALTIHDDGDLAFKAVKASLAAEDNPRVRVEAIQWLARTHGADARVIDLLSILSRTDPDRKVRLEAVDGIRTSFRNGESMARAALERLADDATDIKVRSEAIQALARD